MSGNVDLKFDLNGTPESVEVAPNTLLLDLLRERYRLTGVKASCERAVCGTCTSLVDARPVATCATFAFEVDGCRVETVEGAGADRYLRAAQQAFRECGGFQCGFCTSGMLMLTAALLKQHEEPTDEQIRAWISSNICRCTGYQMILESVSRAAQILNGHGAGVAGVGDEVRP